MSAASTASRTGSPLGVFDEAAGLFFGAADRVRRLALTVAEPDAVQNPRNRERHRDVRDVQIYRQHGLTPREKLELRTKNVER